MNGYKGMNYYNNEKTKTNNIVNSSIIINY